VHVNDRAGDAESAAHLLAFDSVHGRWDREVAADRDGSGDGGSAGFSIEGQRIGFSRGADPAAVPWRQAGVEMVLECSGAIKTPDTLSTYVDAVGLKRVIVACPVKGELAGAGGEGGARRLRHPPRFDHHHPRHQEHPGADRRLPPRSAPRPLRSHLPGPHHPPARPGRSA
jgi:hypothetical protein